MTSNLGAEYLVAQADGEDSERCAIRSWPKCGAHFRPEFLNRIDEIILFHPAQARPRWAASSISRWSGCKSCWNDRKIAAYARRQGARVAGREGLRSGLRRRGRSNGVIP